MKPEHLESWKADEPPHGFVDRVMAARQLELEPPRWKLRIGLAISVAVASLAAVAALGIDPARPPRAGAVVASGRQTLAIGDRAIAVLEPGSDLSFSVKRDGARVILPRGDVFFRVEPGAPFVVATPAGDVEVRGTCFRVEVGPSQAVFVTVYEGKVILANDQGRTEIVAGQSARAESGRAPESAERKVVAKVEATPPPRDDATREELLERDRVQRKELQDLRQKVAERKQEDGKGLMKPGDSFLNPTKGELLAMAKNCFIRFDSPYLQDPETIDGVLAGLSDADRTAAHAAFSETAEKLRAQIRALYVETTGNANAPEDLTITAMWQEIQQKSPREDVANTHKILSAERAGLQPSPPDLASRPAFERAMRLVSDSGNQAEAALAQAIGPEKARALRSAHDGWGVRFNMGACPAAAR